MEHLETFNSNSPKPITVDVIKHAYLNELKNWEEIDINDELFLERLEKAAIQKLENMWDNLAYVGENEEGTLEKIAYGDN